MQAVRRVLLSNVTPRWDEGSAEEYVRQARRLRWRHRHSPGRLHRQLKDLGKGPAARSFQSQAAGAIQDGILTYSRRKSLLRSARRSGIDAFEANLMLALAQHRDPTAGGVLSDDRDRLSHWLLPVLIVLVVQGLLVTAAWRLWS